MKTNFFSLIILLSVSVFLFPACEDEDDPACPTFTWYQDADGDGLGNPDVSLEACEQPTGYVDNDTDTDDTQASVSVNPDFFNTVDAGLTIITEACTLSDGTETQCYRITTNSVPADHAMGPWCPDNIADDASAGGIWLEGGVAYDVDGAFIENLAAFYNDDTWRMYDADGNVYVTETQEDCVNAANPNVGAEYANFCVECLPSYITDLSVSFLIPVTPVPQETAVPFSMGRPRPGEVTAPATRGVALNGVEFSAPAPVDNILGAYTLAPFDDAGGHINVNQGYHYHAATGISLSVSQDDGHAPLIGYAMDGYAIYDLTDEDGNEPTDLDECRGHSDPVRGYHYHVDAAGNNNFINCLRGAFVAD
ncbi:MAG: YHYH protein [Bacteroidota bacterium]